MHSIDVDVIIEGNTSLLQHRFTETAEVEVEKGTRPVKVMDLPPRDQAEHAAYRDNQGNLYHPGAAIMRLLREAGSYHKQKGSRKSMKYIVPAGCLVLTDQIPVLDLENEPKTDFEVDSRPVTIPATKGRIMRHRPRQDEWRMCFRLRINEDVLDRKMIHQLLTEGGNRIGIGDFRPEKGGPFGTFQIVEWNEIKAA